jgi:SAM-dependent methyltransferase
VTALNIAPGPAHFEPVDCYHCGCAGSASFIEAEDDLTGKPGRFRFVTCTECGLHYQSPRLRLDQVKRYYDEEYIAHRKKTDWGLLTPFYRRAMERLDRAKIDLCLPHVSLDPNSSALDVGCGAGTFLYALQQRFGARCIGVDFKELGALPAFDKVAFRHGLFYEQSFGDTRFELITMWHFLEHDYDPPRSLMNARELLSTGGRLVIEVPRLDSLSFRLYGDRWPGLQAPQHTVLFTKASLIAMLDRAGLEVIAYHPYGAFPAYFYLFAGIAFKLLKGRGLNLDRAILPYFIGRCSLSSVD